MVRARGLPSLIKRTSAPGLGCGRDNVGGSPSDTTNGGGSDDGAGAGAGAGAGPAIDAALHVVFPVEELHRCGPQVDFVRDKIKFDLIASLLRCHLPHFLFPV